jgi:hypothetical protein
MVSGSKAFGIREALPAKYQGSLRKMKKHMPKVLTFKHSGNLGDIIYSLPTIIALGGGILFINNEPPDMYNDRGSVPRYPMTSDMVFQMIELLKSQPYLYDIRPHENQAVDFDLDKFRKHLSNEMTWAIARTDHLAHWHLKAFKKKFNLAEPWLYNIEPVYVNDIVIARHTKLEDNYKLNKFNWPALKGYEDRCCFVGFDDEYIEFKKYTGLNIKRCNIKSILEFAKVIKGSKFFIGNQSLGFALAEALKHPRVLEIPYFISSALPLSMNGHIRLNRNLIKRLLNRKRGIALNSKIDYACACLRIFFFHTVFERRLYYEFCKNIVKKYIPTSIKLKKMLRRLKY